MAICSGCGALIVWCRTEKNRSIPIDAERDQHERLRLSISTEGSMAPTGRQVTTRDGGTAPVVRYQKKGPYTPHFATCPNSKEFRRR